MYQGHWDDSYVFDEVRRRREPPQIWRVIDFVLSPRFVNIRQSESICCTQPMALKATIATICQKLGKDAGNPEHPS